MYLKDVNLSCFDVSINRNSIWLHDGVFSTQSLFESSEQVISSSLTFVPMFGKKGLCELVIPKNEMGGQNTIILSKFYSTLSIYLHPLT